jgi:hypothetical protein
VLLRVLLDGHYLSRSNGDVLGWESIPCVEDTVARGEFVRFGRQDPKDIDWFSFAIEPSRWTWLDEWNGDITIQNAIDIFLDLWLDRTQWMHGAGYELEVDANGKQTVSYFCHYYITDGWLGRYSVCYRIHGFDAEKGFYENQGMRDIAYRVGVIRSAIVRTMKAIPF